MGRNLLKILVLDDDPADTRQVCWLLERSENYTCDVTTASCAADALTAFENNKFDVILSDFWLGEEDSIDFIRRTGGRLQGTPIILITSTATREVRQSGLKAGIVASLSKNDLSSSLLEGAIDDAIHSVQLESEIMDQAVGLSSMVKNLPKSDIEFAVDVREKLAEIEEIVEYEMTKSGSSDLTLALEISDEIRSLCSNFSADLEFSPEPEMKTQRLNINEVLIKTLDQMKPLAKVHSLNVVAHVADLPVWVTGHESVYSDIVWLLQKMAVYQVSVGSTIEWRTGFEQGDFCLAVSSSSKLANNSGNEDKPALRNITESLRLVMNRVLRRYKGSLHIQTSGEMLEMKVLIPKKT